MSWDVIIHEVPTFIATCHVGMKVDPTMEGRCEWRGPQRPSLDEAEADRRQHADDHHAGWLRYERELEQRNRGR